MATDSKKAALIRTARSWVEAWPELEWLFWEAASILDNVLERRVRYAAELILLNADHLPEGLVDSAKRYRADNGAISITESSVRNQAAHRKQIHLRSHELRDLYDQAEREGITLMDVIHKRLFPEPVPFR